MKKISLILILNLYLAIAFSGELVYSKYIFNNNFNQVNANKIINDLNNQNIYKVFIKYSDSTKNLGDQIQNYIITNAKCASNNACAVKMKYVNAKYFNKHVVVINFVRN